MREPCLPKEGLTASAQFSLAWGRRASPRLMPWWEEEITETSQGFKFTSAQEGCQDSKCPREDGIDPTWLVESCRTIHSSSLSPRPSTTLLLFPTTSARGRRTMIRCLVASEALLRHTREKRLHGWETRGEANSFNSKWWAMPLPVRVNSPQSNTIWTSLALTAKSTDSLTRREPITEKEEWSTTQMEQETNTDHDRCNHIFLYAREAPETSSTQKTRISDRENLAREQREDSVELLIPSTTTWRAMTSQPPVLMDRSTAPPLITKTSFLDSGITWSTARSS